MRVIFEFDDGTRLVQEIIKPGSTYESNREGASRSLEGAIDGGPALGPGIGQDATNPSPWRPSDTPATTPGPASSAIDGGAAPNIGAGPEQGSAQPANNASENRTDVSVGLSAGAAPHY